MKLTGSSTLFSYWVFFWEAVFLSGKAHIFFFFFCNWGAGMELSFFYTIFGAQSGFFFFFLHNYAWSERAGFFFFFLLPRPHDLLSIRFLLYLLDGQTDGRTENIRKFLGDIRAIAGVFFFFFGGRLKLFTITL